MKNGDISIHYNDTRSGDTTLLFIHGWGINHTYWNDQRERFKSSYRVVTLDLPGFGESGKNRTDWSVEAYANDISSIIKKLELKNVILVGHSMSGSIAIETALTNPEVVTGVVGVDNFKFVGQDFTPELEADWAGFYTQLRADFDKMVRESMGAYLFTESTDSSITERVLHDIAKSDPVIAINSLENTDKYPFSEKLKMFRKKLVLINSSAMPTNMEGIRQLGVKCELLDIGRTSHYPMIEKPKEFNVLLQKALEIILLKDK